jgi:ribonuclease HII
LARFSQISARNRVLPVRRKLAEGLEQTIHLAVGSAVRARAADLFNCKKFVYNSFMKYPNFSEEKKLRQKGCNFVVGLDEAGRGPLAGPVVAGAFYIKNFQFLISNFQSIFNDPILKQVKDSKQLSPEMREKIFEQIKKCPDFVWAVGEVSEKIIDKINILEATKLAMQKAVKNLSLRKCDDRRICVIVDGNMNFKKNWFSKDSRSECIKHESIIKGDQKVFSISAASIIAKVYRDNLMQKYAKKYPQYGFEKHKGYGTKEHFENLEEFGPCPIHRKSFYPISKS